MQNLDPNGPESPEVVTSESIKSKVAQEIANCGPQVESFVVNELVNTEVLKRVELCKQALAKVDTLRKNLNKINRADGATFTDAQGGGKVETYSEARIKEIAAAKKQLEEVTAAFDKALETNTSEAYAKLAEKVK